MCNSSPDLNHRGMKAGGKQRALEGDARCMQTALRSPCLRQEENYSVA